MMGKIKELFTKLDIPGAILIINDENIGNGYIEVNDIVFARWGSYNEGILLLERYLAAISIPNIRE